MGSRPVGIGLAGCGWVSENWHLPALAGRLDARVVALTDVDAQRCRRLAAQFQIDRCHSDTRALVEDETVEVVAVCVPTPAHAEVAALALEAGKHVLIEKPLALTLEDCDRLIDLEEASPGVAMPAFNLRWHRLVRRARTLLDQGAVGPPRLAQTTFTAGSRYREGVAEWRKRRELGGGVIVDQAVHHFDLWRFLLNREVEEVSAVTEGDDEHVGVVARLTEGAIVSATFSDGLPSANELAVTGPEGRLCLSLYRFDGLDLVPANRLAGDPKERLERLRRRLRELPAGVASARRGGDHRASYSAEWDHFLGAVRSGRPVGCTLEDGRRAVEIQLAVLAASAQGRPARPDRPTVSKCSR